MITYYTEPDKEFFFARRMSNFLRRVPDDTNVGVALALRSTGSFESFPPMQRYTESVINHLCYERLGIAGDYSYGPLVVNRALLPHIAGLSNDISGAGARPRASRRIGPGCVSSTSWSTIRVHWSSVPNPRRSAFIECGS